MLNIQGAISNSKTWQRAVRDAIQYYTDEDMCFSSGEVAHDLRTHRPDLRFSVPVLGKYIRDMHGTGKMSVYFMADGSVEYPLRLSRSTQGKGRTMSGAEVYVYCPDVQAGSDHDFEVDIPQVGQQVPVNNTPVPLPSFLQGLSRVNLNRNPHPQNCPHPLAQPNTPPQAPQPPVQLTGRDHGGDLKAKVHKDKRMCVPRSAFEALVKESGEILKGGSEVYVTFTPDGKEILVTKNAISDDSKKHDLSWTRGRVLFTTKTTQFVPGAEYLVEVDKNGMIVRLEKK